MEFSWVGFETVPRSGSLEAEKLGQDRLMLLDSSAARQLVRFSRDCFGDALFEVTSTANYDSDLVRIYSGI
jgi:hypothetical protein